MLFRSSFPLRKRWDNSPALTAFWTHGTICQIKFYSKVPGRLFSPQPGHGHACSCARDNTCITTMWVWLESSMIAWTVNVPTNEWVEWLGWPHASGLRGCPVDIMEQPATWFNYLPGKSSGYSKRRPAIRLRQVEISWLPQLGSLDARGNSVLSVMRMSLTSDSDCPALSINLMI
jgi:hypothetical protein